MRWTRVRARCAPDRSVGFARKDLTNARCAASRSPSAMYISPTRRKTERPRPTVTVEPLGVLREVAEILGGARPEVVRLSRGPVSSYEVAVVRSRSVPFSSGSVLIIVSAAAGPATPTAASNASPPHQLSYEPASSTPPRRRWRRRIGALAELRATRWKGSLRRPRSRGEQNVGIILGLVADRANRKFRARSVFGCTQRASTDGLRRSSGPGADVGILAP